MTITTDAPRTPLDEVRSFLGKFIDASDTQLDAITLWVAHTNVLGAFPASPRLLITSRDPGCGKSETLRRIRDLSQNGWSAKGTSFAIRAKLGEPDRPTITVDEVSDVFGKSGRSGATHPLGTLLRLGYKAGETDCFAQNKVAEEISIYTAAAMAGRGAAVPDDIRSRCVIIKLKPGRPAEDYVIREHEPQARMLRDALGQWVKSQFGEVQKFRARGLHPKLTGRRREIWEPLLAVAKAGGEEWLRRGLSALLDLALDESDQPVLTPQQTVLRDMAKAAGLVELAGGTEDGFALGADLREEMRRMGEPMYETLADRALSMLMAEAVADASPDGQAIVTVGERRGRGYRLADIRAEWAARAPVGSAEEVADTEPLDPDAVEFVAQPDDLTTSTTSDAA
jgi:hypothetical protein